MSERIQSREYKPDAGMCCERCVFGTGAHADWCTFWLAEITRTYLLRAQEATAGSGLLSIFSA